MRRTVTSLSRRTTLGVLGAASAIGLAGCSGLRAPEDDLPDPDAAEEADTALVDTVVTALQGALAGAPTAFARLHEQHLTALDADPGAASPSATPGAGAVRRRERRLPIVFTDAAVDAQSPELGQLFATMAAAQRQLLTVHPEVTA